PGGRDRGGPGSPRAGHAPRTVPGLTTRAWTTSPPTLPSRFPETEITPPSSLGRAAVAGTPSTTPTIMTWLPATVRIAAKARHPPACELDPVLTPVIPSCPRPALTLYARPATGSVTCGRATIWRNAWICIAA